MKSARAFRNLGILYHPRYSADLRPLSLGLCAAQYVPLVNAVQPGRAHGRIALIATAAPPYAKRAAPPGSP